MNKKINEIPADNSKQQRKQVRGVVCDVKNCAYHDGENACFAGQIAVGPSFATSCTDTVCATFKQKSV